MDDDELIDRLAGGDETALRELFARHAPWLAVRLRAALPASDVEDVLQETFTAAWRGARSFRATPGGSVGGWLWGIARNQTAMWLRKRSRDGVFRAAYAEMEEVDVAVAEDAHSAADARMDLDAALATLGPEGGPEREVWRLLFVEDRPVAQVAALTGVPVGTVKSRAHRIRRTMRAALGGGPAGLREGGLG
jgi:RNA polymerase sigma-70 factor, ECF subfamily